MESKGRGFQLYLEEKSGINWKTVLEIIGFSGGRGVGQYCTLGRMFSISPVVAVVEGQGGILPQT